MKPIELRKNETYYLKKEIEICVNETSKIFLRKGTPITLYSKVDNIIFQFSIVGSFISIEVKSIDVNNVIADFNENLPSGY